MGISDTIAPKSDQLDAVDLLTGPMTFTVTSVVVKGGEQPVDIGLAEFPRPWRPGKSMRRVLVNVWGHDETAYVGRRLTLFCDERVMFGGQAVGGVRISHMSGLVKDKGTPLIISKGKGAVYVVKPLPDAPDAPTEPTAEQVATSTDKAALGAMWKASGPERRAQIEARVAELMSAESDGDPNFPAGDPS